MSIMLTIVLIALSPSLFHLSTQVGKFRNTGRRCCIMRRECLIPLCRRFRLQRFMSSAEKRLKREERALNRTVVNALCQATQKLELKT
jgi:hypothetical protein